MMGIVLLFLILCGAVHVQSQGTIWKSQTGPQHTIELLVVMDTVAFDSWYQKTAVDEAEQVRRNKTHARVADFFASVVVGVSDLFESVRKYGLALDVRLKKIHFLEKDLWTEKDLQKGGDPSQVSKDLAIKLFYRWLWKVRAAVGMFDHGLLITGYDLIDLKNPKKMTQGVAYQAAMCRIGSVSVVENGFTHRVIDTVAHELGHSLGCEHDEDTKCSGRLGHVMSIRTDINSTNRWSFSPCSADTMINNITELSRMNANCLLRTTTIPTSGKELGALMGPDQQCQMKFGPEAFFCREFYATPESYGKMCSSMWCSPRLGSKHCVSLVSSDGFTCGQDKVCRRGNCTLISTPLADPVSADACPQGDQPGVVHKKLTCSEAISSQPWLCYQAYFHTKCCRSCSAVKGSVLGCEYGNKASWCATGMKYPYDCYLNNHTCCQSCRKYWKKDKPGCEYGDRTRDCKTKLSVPTGCYENEAICCETCAQVKSTTNQDCPYGDRSRWCQEKLQVPNGCYLNQELCCGTCGDLANKTMTARLQEAESAQNDTSSPPRGSSKPADWCLFGDRHPEWCQKESPFICYNSTLREWCCQTCPQFEKLNHPGCEYGDRHKACDNLVYPYACYDQNNARLCCHTCRLYRRNGRSDCLYGDHEAWCYKLNEKYTNEQWCHLDRKNGHCCGTCLYQETDIPVFGSRVRKLGVPKPK